MYLVGQPAAHCGLSATPTTSVTVSLSLHFFAFPSTKQMSGRWSLDLLLVSSYRSVLPGLCRLRLFWRVQFYVFLDCTKRFETPVDVT